MVSIKEIVKNEKKELIDTLFNKVMKLEKDSKNNFIRILIERELNIEDLCYYINNI